MLIKDVESVGQAGDVKDVADGYGRNYLIPRRLAIVAGKGAEAEARRLREGVAKREAKERDDAQELAELIDNKTVVVRLKVGAEDKVFGAITNDDIATALRLQHQVEVDRRKIELKDPLKQLGEHQVPLRLHREVTANINLIITQDRLHHPSVPGSRLRPFTGDVARVTEQTYDCVVGRVFVSGLRLSFQQAYEHVPGGDLRTRPSQPQPPCPHVRFRFPEIVLLVPHSPHLRQFQ